LHTGKVKVVVVTAGGVEGGSARRADGVALKILVDGELGVAGSTEDGLLAPCGLGPDLDGVPSENDVTVLAGVVQTATFHFDGDDVEGTAVVYAARLGIEFDAVNNRGAERHWAAGH
jgi:hypothetical protein